VEVQLEPRARPPRIALAEALGPAALLAAYAAQAGLPSGAAQLAAELLEAAGAARGAAGGGAQHVDVTFGLLELEGWAAGRLPPLPLPDACCWVPAAGCRRCRTPRLAAWRLAPVCRAGTAPSGAVLCTTWRRAACAR
jgi:hypothetical protein